MESCVASTGNCFGGVTCRLTLVSYGEELFSHPGTFIRISRQIIINFDEIRWENVDRVHLTQDKEEGWVHVNLIMSFGAP
jgi:DNA-binding LytR/AlgR family response regulator